MGLEKVIAEILSAGKKQRFKIISEAEEEKGRLVSEAKAEAESTGKEMDKETEQRVALMRQQALSSAELEAKKRILQEQNRMLSQVKQEVLRALSARNSRSCKSLLETLGKIAAKRLNKGIIHYRKEDENIFIPPVGFRKLCDLRASGGIIAESEDGAYRIDLTFESLLEDLWSQNVRAVYNILFGGA